MAITYEFSKEQQKIWDDWVNTRPPIIQAMCRDYPPNRLFLLKTTGQRVTLYSYNENKTVTVLVEQEYNPERFLIFERQVFGINPDDLEECEIPVPTTKEAPDDREGRGE